MPHLETLKTIPFSKNSDSSQLGGGLVELWSSGTRAERFQHKERPPRTEVVAEQKWPC